MSISFPFQHMFILPILVLTPQKVATLEDSRGDTVYPLKANMEPNIIFRFGRRFFSFPRGDF